MTIVSPGLEPLADDDVVAHPLRDGDRPLLHGGIGLDDEDELAVLTGLDRLARNDRRLRQRRQPQAHARELTGPQPEILVGERRLQLDGVGRGVDEVVDEGELPVGRLLVPVLRSRHDRHWSVPSIWRLIVGRCAAGTVNVT